MPETRLVGRERQLADLDSRLAAAREGTGALVLVQGDAGIGKTALAHAAVHKARAAGVPAVWGACLESEGTEPYRPWVQILHGLGQPVSLLTDPAGDPTGSRFQVFDAVVEMLRRASTPHGLLVVVDDLHWADVPSLRLLQSVASIVDGSRLLVFGLYRGRDAFPYAEVADMAGVLRALLRERAAVPVTLGGLADTEVAELATRTLGHRPEESLLRAVQERAEGNPLFVLELLRLVESSARLPDSIGEVIGRRLDRLPAPARHALRRAAVLGREFTAGTLAAMTDDAPDALHDIFDHAIVAGLLTVDGHLLRFDHALTQEVLYAELTTTGRQRLHARAAAAIRDADAASGALDTLAHHLRRAAPLGGAEEALAVTVRAAVQARSQLAYEHAAFQYRAALELLALVPGGGAQRSGLLLALARCEFRSGAVEDAWRSCREAADLGRAADDPATVADAATVLRGITQSTVTGQIHAMCRDALAMLHGADPVREARLLAQLAITVDPFATEGEPGRGLRALRAAEATGDPDARFLAMQARQTELVDGRYVLERLSIGERAVLLGRETGNDEYRTWGHTWRLDAFAELGRRPQLDAELATFANLVGHLKEPLWLWRLTMIQASLALLEGGFDRARALADRALTIGRRGGHEGAEFFHLVFSAHVATLTGDGLDVVEPAVRRFVEHGPFFARNWLAVVLVDAGRLDEAAQIWAAMVPHLDDFPRHAPEWIVAAVSNAELCVRFTDRATAATLYSQLDPYADRQAVVGAHTPSYGPVSLYLGMLATLLEDWTAAEAHLGTALATSTAMGSLPYQARTGVETARLLLRRGRPQDAGPARDRLRAALRTAHQLGMSPLESEIAAVRDRDAARPTRAARLTAREEQVAALVAEGLSNRQIAHRLHLSERTAENHVTHILTKLGFESRARVASWYATRDSD